MAGRTGPLARGAISLPCEDHIAVGETEKQPFEAHLGRWGLLDELGNILMHGSLVRVTGVRGFLARGETPPAKPPRFPPLPAGSILPISRKPAGKRRGVGGMDLN